MKGNCLKCYFKGGNKAYYLQKLKPTCSKTPAVLSSLCNAKPAGNTEQGAELGPCWKKLSISILRVAILIKSMICFVKTKKNHVVSQPGQQSDQFYMKCEMRFSVSEFYLWGKCAAIASQQGTGHGVCAPNCTGLLFWHYYASIFVFAMTYSVCQMYKDPSSNKTNSSACQKCSCCGGAEFRFMIQN